MNNLLRLIFLTLLSFHSHAVDFKIDSNSSMKFNTASGAMSLALTSGLSCNIPIESGINSFLGPCLSDNCSVEPRTPFQLHWDVENVLGCEAIGGTLDWIGNVDPLGGGTGTYSKEINGITEDTTFSLSCKTTSNSKFTVNVDRVEVNKIKLNGEMVLMSYATANRLFLLNIIDSNNEKTTMETMRYVKEDVLFQNVKTNNIKKESIVFEGELGQDPTKMVWLYITEKNPNIENIYHPYDMGRCDGMGSNPQVNLSTKPITTIDLMNTCSLLPDKEYFLVRYILTN